MLLELLGNRCQHLVTEVDCVDRASVGGKLTCTMRVIPEKMMRIRLSVPIVGQGRVGTSSSNESQMEPGTVRMNIQDSSPVMMLRN
jgi:hypothetical protein